MDLSRAKTVLIIAFLLLNLFLAFRLWLIPPHLQAGVVLTGEEAEQAKNVLVSAGYEVLTAIPRQIPRLSLLHVSRHPQEPESWPASVWCDANAKRGVDTENVSFINGEETLQIAPNGVVTLHFGKPDRVSTGHELHIFIESFLKERGLWSESLKFDMAMQDGSHTRYRYLQTYQGFPLFFSYTDVKVVDGRISEIRLYHVLPLEFTGKEIQTVSVAEAADAFVKAAQFSEVKKIIDISLGYYSQDYDAKRWEIVPVWRFALTDGTVFYINAFTGGAEL